MDRPPPPMLRVAPVEIPAAGVSLCGDLTLPASAPGLVLFAHGSGSSRLSPRNRAVAAHLVEAGFGTLLLDLLSADEERREQAGAVLRFDVELLGRRLVAVLDWLAVRPSTAGLPVGLFGASTGAAAALIAAVERPDAVRAVVSRGGRPDLAGAVLGAVRAPTLLIVGGDDLEVLELNRRALAALKAPAELSIVPGATHLFEEPGTLERVAELAAWWFKEHLTGSPG